MQFIEQMKKLHDENDDYGNIWLNDDWEMSDVQDFFYYVDKGYLIQDELQNYFIINPCWEEEPLWEELDEVKHCNLIK